MSGEGTSTSSASPPTVLARILEETRAEVQWRKRNTPLSALEQQCASAEARSSSAPLREGLTRPGIRVIAEFKRRSPSAGPLHAAPDLAAIVNAYERGGASALSVLTEGSNFGGSLEDLRAARALCGLPILRKDFIVDPYQLYEARAAGADAVLLIVAALDGNALGELHALAHTLELEVLVEVHDSDELARAASIGAQLIGINNRDLRDFSVDVQRTTRLMGEMPAGVTVVSESGISSAQQLRSLEAQGVAAVLVGETLMRAADPAQTLAELLAGSASR